jgi:hypothetical protein
MNRMSLDFHPNLWRKDVVSTIKKSGTRFNALLQMSATLPFIPPWS